MLDKPFLTTVVGSMPRPKFFRERVDRHLVEGTGEGDLIDLMDRSIPYVAALQEAAGVDVISDGEWRRKSYVGVIAEMLTGVEQFKVPLDSFRHDARVGYAVIGPVAPTREGLFAEEATKLRGHTSKAVRVALPTPHLTAGFLWDPVKSPEHYSEREFIEVMVPILRREVELLRDAGVRYVQFDDTGIGGVHAEEPESQAYRDALFDSVDTLNRVVDGIDGIYTSLHLCGKRHIGPDQVPRYDTMLPGFERLHIDMPMFEMLQFDDYDRELLRGLPERMDVGCGCVASKTFEVDTPEEIAARARETAKIVGPERTALHPDCGFSPGTYFDIPLDEIYQKLGNMTRAAEMLRAEM